MRKLFRRRSGEAAAPPRIELVTRRNCHLCEEMEEVLDQVLGERGLVYSKRDVDSDAELSRRFGEVVPVLLRDGRPVDVTVKIGNLEDAVRKIAASLKDRLGAVVRPLTAEETQQYGLEPGQGVALGALDAGSMLAKAGFEKDDVILSINNAPVNGVQGFVSLAKALPAHQQAVFKALDHRTGQSGLVQITVG